MLCERPLALRREERAAATKLVGMREEAPEGTGALDTLRARLDDDLDVPGALDVLDRCAAEGRPVGAGAALLGLDVAG